MRDIELIQDDNVVLHVPVHKMNPKVGEISGLPWSPLDWTVNLLGCMREGKPVLHQGGME